LRHLQNGLSITPQDALKHYGSFRLAAHIEVLRKEGHPIITTMVKNNGSEFASYKYLLGEKNGI
jgi:hypothetical protein